MNNLLKVGAGEMTQRLRLLVVLARAWVQFPVPTRWLTSTYNSSAKGPGTSGFHGLLHVCGAHKLMQAFMLIHINKNKQNFKSLMYRPLGLSISSTVSFARLYVSCNESPSHKR